MHIKDLHNLQHIFSDMKISMFTANVSEIRCITVSLEPH